MGRFERKIERLFWRSLFGVSTWLLLAPFKILKWLFLGGQTNNKNWVFLGSQSTKKKRKNEYVRYESTNEFAHRYIARKRLGRNLYPNEVVHHINGRKGDNRLINLCVMDRDKHEQVHAWLKWHRQKMGRYPSFKVQKRMLESNYGGILLEKLPRKSSFSKPKEEQVVSAQDNDDGELFLARKNIATQKLFLEFEDEVLIGPDGNIVEIDEARFERSKEVKKSLLTSKQLEVYQNKLKHQDREFDSAISSSHIQKQLFKELKQERMKIARAKKVPAYIIFYDSTLLQMAEVRPVSKSLLLQINGVGPEKARMYGDRFLRVIRDFNTKDEGESA